MTDMSSEKDSCTYSNSSLSRALEDSAVVELFNALGLRILALCLFEDSLVLSARSRKEHSG